MVQFRTDQENDMEFRLRLALAEEHFRDSFFRRCHDSHQSRGVWVATYLLPIVLLQPHGHSPLLHDSLGFLDGVLTIVKDAGGQGGLGPA